jgi:hypothetical protein
MPMRAGRFSNEADKGKNGKNEELGTKNEEQYCQPLAALHSL